MTRIITSKQEISEIFKSIVSFDKKGGGNWEVWHRLISIDGKPAYEIGNICGTCSFYFERLEGANQSIHPENLIEQLNIGLTELDQETINTVSKIIPNGKYKVILMSIIPKLVELGDESDYFAKAPTDFGELHGFSVTPTSSKD